MKVSLYFRNGDVIYCNNCTTMISLWIDEDNHLRNSVGTEHPTKFYPGDCLKDFIIRCDELMDVRSGDEGLFVVSEAVISFDEMNLRTNFPGYYLSDSDETGIIRRIYTNIPTRKQMFNAFAAIVVCDSTEEIPDEVKSDAASFYQDLQQHMDVWCCC